jgi:hypothetical protein
MDIALISETQFTAKTAFRMQTYKVYHIPHPYDRAHGDAAVITRNSISHYDSVSEHPVAFTITYIKDVPGGMSQTLGGCSLC